MKLTRTSDGYVVQVPEDVVAALGLRDGDEVALTKPADKSAFERLARPLPAGYRFDREEANAR